MTPDELDALAKALQGLRVEVTTGSANAADSAAQACAVLTGKCTASDPRRRATAITPVMTFPANCARERYRMAEP
jgi:hypothetical protein